MDRRPKSFYHSTSPPRVIKRSFMCFTLLTYIQYIFIHIRKFLGSKECDILKQFSLIFTLINNLIDFPHKYSHDSKGILRLKFWAHFIILFFTTSCSMYHFNHSSFSHIAKVLGSFYSWSNDFKICTDNQISRAQSEALLGTTPTCPHWLSKNIW